MKRMVMMITLLILTVGLVSTSLAYRGVVTLEVTDYIYDDSNLDADTREAVKRVEAEIKRNQEEMGWKSTSESDKEWLAKEIDRKKAYIEEITRNASRKQVSHEVTVFFHDELIKLAFKDGDLIFKDDQVIVVDSQKKAYHVYNRSDFLTDFDKLTGQFPTGIQAGLKHYHNRMPNKAKPIVESTEKEGAAAGMACQIFEARQGDRLVQVCVSKKIEGLTNSQKLVLWDWRMLLKPESDIMLADVFLDSVDGIPLEVKLNAQEHLRTVTRVTSLLEKEPAETEFSPKADFKKMN